MQQQETNSGIMGLWIVWSYQWKACVSATILEIFEDLIDSNEIFKETCSIYQQTSQHEKDNIKKYYNFEQGSIHFVNLVDPNDNIWGNIRTILMICQ